MNREAAALVLVILTVIAVIGLNYLLIQSVRSTARRTDRNTLKRLLDAAKNPFQTSDRDLDTLAELVEKLSGRPAPGAENDPPPGNIDKEDQV